MNDFVKSQYVSLTFTRKQYSDIKKLYFKSDYKHLSHFIIQEIILPYLKEHKGEIDDGVL